MLTIKNVDLANHQFKGYKAGEASQLSCSACGKKILDLVVVQDKIDVSLRYRAKCHLCGDYSYPIEIVGQVLVNPVDDNFEIADVRVEASYLTAILKKKVTHES